MQITILTPNRDYLCPRALHLKRMKNAAAWRREAVMMRRMGDTAAWRRLMAYACQCTDEAARYRVKNAIRMKLPS